ncbi:hypothetical protein [Azohydromonas australica]|uniref:hypothetical protein n=1 Tax=Azohydromonas australica TaxID=364039 RepID=UPI00146EE631|nr:hypothetical protein [Azohydromonas australica]
MSTAAVVHCSEHMLLVRVDNDSVVDVLCGRLHGWVVSQQARRLQVPDTRLRLGSEEQ